MELWDIYDSLRNKTGRTMIRGNKFLKGDYHLVVHICVFNSKGEMLIQQRQSFKEGWPSMWSLTASGSAVAGDNSQTAASRELYEEVGIKHDFTGILPKISMHSGNSLFDYYIIETDVDIECLSLQYEEVQAVEWATKDEILEMINLDKFIPYRLSFIELIFDLRKSLGPYLS